MSEKPSNLDILRNMGKVAEELRNSPQLTEAQWEAIDRKIEKLHKRQAYERELIRMTPEKFRQPFTI